MNVVLPTEASCPMFIYTFSCEFKLVMLDENNYP